MKRTILCWTLLVILTAAGYQAHEARTIHVSVLVDGLVNPAGLALLPDGALLIAEEGTGDNDQSAGVSLRLPDGTVGRLISGLRSSRDSGDLSGVALVGVSPDQRTIYMGNFSQGHLWTLPVDAATDLSDEPYATDTLGKAMEPLNRVVLTNPFDITFDTNGVPVVSDASQNGVAKETADGKTQFIHRFDALVNPTNERLTIDAVPTGIERIEDEYYVTLTGGCPYPPEGGELVAIDENRNQRTVVDNLNMPIDVAQAEDGTIWVLEFARFSPEGSCFSGSGYLPNTGRLSRLTSDETLEPVVENLNFPVSVQPLPDGSLYISEIFDGEILHVTFTEQETPIGQAASTSRMSNESTTASDWRLYDVAGAVGLDFHHGAFAVDLSEDYIAMMGAGLCWIDYNNDGWLDLYLVNSHSENETEYWMANGGLPRNALYRNIQGRFQRVERNGTDIAMRGNGCVAADFNLDGWTDLYVTADGPDVLLWNNADGTFKTDPDNAGIHAPEWNSAAAVADLNADGWPDLFVGGYIDLARTIPKPFGAFPQDYLGIPDRLYISKGPGADGYVKFREVTIESGLMREERALGAIFSDVDRDGDLDLYIANDGQPNRLYENIPYPQDPLAVGFRFHDLTDTAEAGDAGSGMGVASADYDGDGYFDLFVTNWDTELNALYRNETHEEGFINFRYSTFRIGMRGLGNNMTGWGTTWADFDHDTDIDLLTVNGRVPVINLLADPELARLYGNRLVEHGRPQYFEWTEAVGLEAVGTLLARGSATADYDNDGDLDIAINTIAGDAVLLQNEGVTGNWLQVQLADFAPGTIVTLTLPDERQLVREWHAGSSYLASEDPRLHFGLGEAEIVPELLVQSPYGKHLKLENLPVNRVVNLNLKDHPDNSQVIR